jgi:hypothetical protein
MNPNLKMDRSGTNLKRRNLQAAPARSKQLEGSLRLPWAGYEARARRPRCPARSRCSSDRAELDPRTLVALSTAAAAAPGKPAAPLAARAIEVPFLRRGGASCHSVLQYLPLSEAGLPNRWRMVQAEAPGPGPASSNGRQLARFVVLGELLAAGAVYTASQVSLRSAGLSFHPFVSGHYLYRSNLGPQ